MPLIHSHDYKPPIWLFNGHLQTIVPSQFRKAVPLSYHRERVSTPDKDFLLLDWAGTASDKLAIISHGLEGDSQRPYMRGMARAFVQAGYRVLAWNFRGCGGEMNHTLRFYHSGATTDLDFIVHHALGQGHFKKVVLVGFSLGGNLTLKYFGERDHQHHAIINKAIVFSVPLDLHSSSLKIGKASNFIYSQRFLKNLKKKISEKELQMPEGLSTRHFSQIKSLKDFDDFYTAPLHGFKDAVDYYTQCSSLHYLNGIKIPTLIVNAKNDPFLSETCYPEKLLISHPNVYFLAPDEGGHVGFMPRGLGKDNMFWSEKTAVHFAENGYL